MSDTEPVVGCYAASSISLSCIKGQHFCIPFVSSLSQRFVILSIMLTVLKVIGTL